MKVETEKRRLNDESVEEYAHLVVTRQETSCLAQKYELKGSGAGRRAVRDGGEVGQDASFLVQSLSVANLDGRRRVFARILIDGDQAWILAVQIKNHNP